MTRLIVVLAACLFAIQPLFAQELTVFPAQILLDGPHARQRVLASLPGSDGHVRDVTGEVSFESDSPAVFTVNPAGVCEAVADGQGQLIIRGGAQSIRVPVEVRNRNAAQAVSFANDVGPVLTKAGCNQGACHGKTAGQNGFRLSLRGYAPDLDWDWITREYAGRRVSFAAPAASLLLRKARGEMAHGGGRILGENSRMYDILLTWIEQGAAPPLAAEPHVERLEVWPQRRTLKKGDTQRLAVRAHYTDGRIRDVTWLTQFAANDAAILNVDGGGRVTARRNGETAVRASFDGLVEIAMFTVPYEREVEPSAFPAAGNYVDRHVFAKLAELRIEPSPLCTDEAFIRRLYLDAAGMLPAAEEIRRFAADQDPRKREKLVDAVLARPEFVDYWTLQLADLLQNRRERDHDVRGSKGVQAFHYWLRKEVAENRPWDELAHRVLTAAGNTQDSPQLGYYIVTVGEQRQPEHSEVVASVAQGFLGTRIGCAKCHNHPLERYTQNDYYHFAAFFSRMKFDRNKPEQGPTSLTITSEEIERTRSRLKRAEENLQKLAADADQRKRERAQRQVEQLQQQLKRLAEGPVCVTHPRTGSQMVAQPLDREPVEIPGGKDPRRALAEWITSPENEYFAGAMVNRLIKHYLGVGLVEPVDDLRATNPPSNPELWDALVGDFVKKKYDLRALMRVILTSRTYQLSSQSLPSNQTDARYFSHYYARRLPAEVLMDAISHSTQVPDKFPGYPEGMRAVQIPDPGVDSYFLTLFGRSGRVTACACERSGEITLPQLLHLQNGDNVLNKIRSGDGRLGKLLSSDADDRQIIEELFLATLGRRPTREQTARILANLKSQDDRRGLYEDLFWALLNSKDFAFNR